MTIKIAQGTQLSGLNIQRLEIPPYVEMVSNNQVLKENHDYTIEEVDKPGIELHLPSLGFPVFFSDKR